MPSITPGCTLKALQEVSQGLREADRAEVEASSGMAATDALRASVEVSDQVFTLEHEGAAFALYGVREVPKHPRVGLVWLMATDGLRHNRVWFARNSARIWATVSDGFDLHWNYSDTGNALHRRWLEWSGCSFHSLCERGGRTFQEFTRPCASP